MRIFLFYTALKPRLMVFLEFLKVSFYVNAYIHTTEKVSLKWLRKIGRNLRYISYLRIFKMCTFARKFLCQSNKYPSRKAISALKF